MCRRKPKRYERRDDGQGRFRSSKAWTRKSLAIRKRDGYLCRLCLSRGRLTGESLSVHHIVPLVESMEGALDDLNLVTLCPICHEEAERGDVDRDELRRLAASPLALPPRS